MGSREDAQRLLQHYLGGACRGEDFEPWDNDNRVELDMLLDAIIDAATEATTSKLKSCPWQPCGTMDCCEFGPPECKHRVTTADSEMEPEKLGPRGRAFLAGWLK